MEVLAQVVAAVAAVVALALSIVALLRQARHEESSYLVLGLRLSRVSPDWLVAETTLENRSPVAKRLDRVFLLVSPLTETPTAACTAVHAKHGGAGRITSLADLGQAFPVATGASADHYPVALHADDRLLLALPYYVEENSEVGDETLCFEVPIHLPSCALTAGEPYSVRLLLYGPDRLHRVVHRCFVA